MRMRAVDGAAAAADTWRCAVGLPILDARFATSGINYGLFCATPSVPVSRNISRKQAFEMVFTGEFIDAPTALSWGLINRIAAGNTLDAEVLRLARVLMKKPPEVVAAGKAFFYSQLEHAVADAYRIAAAHITDNMLGEAAQEGVAAFTEKREPAWVTPGKLTDKHDG